jgi:hypothetical protein
MDNQAGKEVTEVTPTNGVERMERSSADRVKGHTLEIEKELGMIAKAIKKEQAGKISFTKEEQKRILEASGTIRAAASRGDSGPASSNASRGKSAETRSGSGDAEDTTQAGGRERKRDAAPRGIQTEGLPGKKVQRQEKAAPKEAQETQKTQTSKEPKGEEEKKKERQPKESNPQEGSWKTVSYASKLKAKEETTVKIQGKSAEEVKAKLVRTLDIERIGGPLSQVIPTKRGEVVLVSRSEEQRKMLETVLRTTEGIEMGVRRKLNPTVTLTGLEAGWKEEEIVEEVFQKNEWIRNTSTRK